MAWTGRTKAFSIPEPEDIYVVADTPHGKHRILPTDLTGREAIRREREHEAELQAKDNDREIDDDAE